MSKERTVEERVEDVIEELLQQCPLSLMVSHSAHLEPPEDLIKCIKMCWKAGYLEGCMRTYDRCKDIVAETFSAKVDEALEGLKE